ncbi:MAG TPA: dihydrolipoamide acetyltransferase family protein [Gaiellaceae bacterium]|nr:dihydrolipoamide acetyltransferase family protein [Gaiellaceae bacterium]
MAYEFKLPDLGEGLTEGEIARWLVAEGQDVAEDDPLVEIATDKTTVEIPSPASGTVSRILVSEGEVVPVGTVLVVIGGDGSTGHVPVAGTETRPDQTSVAAPAPGEGKVRATPLVRKVAQELGIDLAAVTGTGPQGRITEEDVRAAATSGLVPVPGTETRPERTRVPLRGVRRQMFEHLTRAHREIPAVTWVEECDFSNVELKLVVPLVLHAVTESLREYPELNARVEDGELVLLDRYDVGVAVQTEQGLVVPVVHGCDRLSLDQLDAEAQRLAEAAHAGSLKPEELRGGTFTVTSAGKAAGLFVTPLINHPEVAILGVHRIEERPVVRDGEVVVRRMGNISVTFDHRVVDGRRAAEFGLAVIARLETRPA